MYNDELMPTENIMEKMKDEYTKVSGEFLPYEQVVGGKDKDGDLIDRLCGGYVLAEMIETVLKNQRKKGRFHQKSLDMARCLANTFQSVYFKISGEDVSCHRSFVSNAKKIRDEYSAMRNATIVDYTLFLLEKTDEIILVRHIDNDYLCLCYQAMRLAQLVGL